MSSIAQSIFTMPALPEVGHNDFERAARILHARAGIVLGGHKQEMAERTLAMRAKSLHMANVTEYLDHIEINSQSPQWEKFVNAFTINQTAFFLKNKHTE